MKTTVKRLLSLVAILLVLVLSLTSCDYIETMMVMLEFIPDTYHASVNFNSLEYERPDIEKAKAAIDGVYDVMERNGRDKELLEAYLEVSKQLDNIRMQSALVNVLHNRDVTNEEYTAESEWLTEASAEFTSALAHLNYALSESKYADILFGDISAEEKELVRKQALLMDEEYADIQVALKALTNEYDALTTEKLTLPDGCSYTMAEVRAGEIRHGGDADAYFAEYNRLAGEIYLELIPYYQRMAEKCEYESVAEMQYEIFFGRSYGPDDTKFLKDFVKDYVPVLFYELMESLTKAEKDALDACEEDKDHLGNAKEVLKQYFSEMSALSMPEVYRYMENYHLSDIGNGENRAQISYTTYLSSAHIPYLFLTTDGSYEDVLTFVHEFGHFTAFYHGGNVADLDIAELHSQGNEYLFMPYFGQLYGKDAAAALEKRQWISAMDILIQGCVMDEFQQRTFASDVDTVEELNEAFVQVAEEFGMDMDAYLLPGEYLWSMIPHNFIYPFYYISYAVSLVPAMELGVMAKADRNAAIEAYTFTVANGSGAYTFEGLLEGAGLSSPFSKEAGEMIVAGVEAIVSGDEVQLPDPPQGQVPDIPTGLPGIFLSYRKED